MILPILISLSLTPGSYFFCALAVATTAALKTNDTKVTRAARPSCIVSSRFFVSVTRRARTGKNLHIPQDETRGCCPETFVVQMRPSLCSLFEGIRLEVHKPLVGPRHPRLGAA